MYPAIFYGLFQKRSVPVLDVPKILSVWKEQKKLGLKPNCAVDSIEILLSLLELMCKELWMPTFVGSLKKSNVDAMEDVTGSLHYYLTLATRVRCCFD